MLGICTTIIIIIIIYYESRIIIIVIYCKRIIHIIVNVIYCESRIATLGKRPAMRGENRGRVKAESEDAKLDSWKDRQLVPMEGFCAGYYC